MDVSNEPVINRTMPACTILPVLGYADVAAAIDWLCETFGFRERWRVGNHRAQLVLNDGVVVVTEKQNGATANNDHSVMVQVKNVDEHFNHAVAQGAVITDSPADFPFGERQYTVQDIGGHRWTFTQSIKDVAPEDWGGTTAI